MNFWNEILHAAILGSDKKSVDPSALTPDLAPLAEQITAETPEKEERLLKLAAIAFNYRQAGVLPQTQEGLTLSHAVEEEKSYCPTSAMQALGDILQENNPPLIHLWLRLCLKKGQIVRPDILPLLLQTTATNKLLQPDVLVCGGKRAEWLGKLNPDWAFASGTGETKEDTWQTGSPQQRRLLLQDLRREDPDTARQWLQQTWTQDDANIKLELLQQLTISLGDNDLPFLESLAGEKGKKIKDMALSLQKKIPSSAIVGRYWAVVQNALTTKKERTLLGLSKKTVLQLTPPATIDKAIFDSGIEKLSNQKGVTDDEYLILQLLQYIPLSFLETALKLTTAELIHLFQDDPLGKKLFPALAHSMINFSDTGRAMTMIQESPVFYPDLLSLLPEALQDRHSVKFFTESPDKIIEYAARREEEWSMDLTRLIIEHGARNPYKYYRSFFINLVYLIPVSLADTPPPSAAELDGAWRNLIDAMIPVLHLKQRTINAFK